MVMKRKVIQLAGKTYVVSLPSKWVKKYGIQKGDELEVCEESNTISYSKQKAKAYYRKEINISGLGNMARRYIGATYKAGYDEVKVYFDDPSKLQTVQNEVDTFLIGVEVLEEGSNYCLLKKISVDNALEFNTVLRNVFRTIITIGNDFVEAASKGDIERLNNLRYRDRNINKFTDFCRRHLNKYGYSEASNTNLLYFVSEELEKIGDCYRDLSVHCIEKEITASKKVINIVDSINVLFRLMYENFYSLNNESMEEIYKLRKKINKSIEKSVFSVDRMEISLLMICYNLTNMIFDCNGSIIIKSLL